MQGNKISSIIKQWESNGIECCKPEDNIMINFPHGMCAEDKAGLIAAVLLSNYNLWE